MPFDVLPLLPAVITFSAALVAGGIARSNLIATKETKISEFRQAWIDSLRDELAKLFSYSRTLARAVQEDRNPQFGVSVRYRISDEKITEVRHGSAETYYRIKLRLNRDQDDHKDLSHRLARMMEEMQQYLNNNDTDAAVPLSYVEQASDFAEQVLKSEWNTVKRGEKGFRNAVATTTWVLVITGLIWAAVIVGGPIYFLYNKAS
ncbi:MAG: hypothetical protein JWR22_3351 [Herminiimonas sp.]|nr:hypothetical protein [Herminiimonas sp.]